jgi:hypothetical protein
MLWVLFGGLGFGIIMQKRCILKNIAYQISFKLLFKLGTGLQWFC